MDNDALKTTNTILTTVESRSDANLDVEKDALDGKIRNLIHHFKLICYIIILINNLYSCLVEIECFTKELENSKSEELLRVNDGFINLKVSLDVENSSKYNLLKIIYVLFVYCIIIVIIALTY